MSWTRKIKAGLVKYPAAEYVGKAGQIFYNIDTGELFLSDGKTPGGQKKISISEAEVTDVITSTVVKEYVDSLDVDAATLNGLNSSSFPVLNESGLVPAENLPSFVDDIEEYPSFADFPETGEDNKIYVDLEENRIYRWSGSMYIEISASPGSTDQVPEGTSNLYWTEDRFDISFANKTTTDLSEGENQYFTVERARQSVSAEGDLEYDPSTGVFSVTVNNGDFDQQFSSKTTDDLSEGSSNLYYTNNRVNSLISLSDDLAKTYDNVAGNLEISTTATSSNAANRIVKRSSTNSFATSSIVVEDDRVPSEREVTWNDTIGSLAVGLKGGFVKLQVGQEIIKRVVNRSGSSLSPGQVVFIAGASGNRLEVQLASADPDLPFRRILGMVSEPISNNQSGYITVIGSVNKLNTSQYEPGDRLWLSLTPGELTDQPPPVPSRRFCIGVVIRSHASVGSMFVNPCDSISTDNLSDVDSENIQTGQTLAWNGTYFEPTWFPESASLENSNFIIASSVDDLPELSGDEHTIPEDTTLIVSGNINLGSSAIRLLNGSTIKGVGLDSITSTNVNGVIRATNIGSCSIKEIKINSSAGKCLLAAGNESGTINISGVDFNGEAAGEISGFNRQHIRRSSITCNSGLTFAGESEIVEIERSFFDTTENAIVIKESVDTDVFLVDYNILDVDDGSAIFAESGYEVTQGRAESNILVADTELLDGISESDSNWKIS